MVKTEMINCRDSMESSRVLYYLSLLAREADRAKGEDLVILDLKDAFPLADYFLILSARSDRHSQGICNRLVEVMYKEGIKSFCVEGYDQGHWVLVDFGDIIVHIFYKDVREQYSLESLWLVAEKVDIKRLISKYLSKEAA